MVQTLLIRKMATIEFALASSYSTKETMRIIAKTLGWMKNTKARRLIILQL